VFIDRKNQIVIAKFSSQALPMDEKRILLTVRGIEAIRRNLLAQPMPAPNLTGRIAEKR
jgi:hypothetical protein